ncbi:MAG: hypothetical protein VKJ64_05155 [Leptolyngbyaceae bacterium]|nr:hypothetical protein [Leptolyngbyaceae bacterium]
MTNQTLSPRPLLECPSCSRHTIVEHRTGVYRCIACDFERDLEAEDFNARRNRRSNRNASRYSPEKDDNDVNPLPLFLIGAIFVILLI